MKGGECMKFYEGMILKYKNDYVYRLDVRVNVYRAPAWIAFRFPTGNVIEGRCIVFEDTLEKHLQNHDIKIIKR